MKMFNSLRKYLNLNNMAYLVKISSVFALLLFLYSCKGERPSETPVGPQLPNYGYNEPVPDTVSFTEVEAYYNGDDIGEATSDGWIFKFYTDMEFDEMGNLVGPGSLAQLLLNVPYEESQQPVLDNLKGVFLSQSNSGDFSPNTFCFGYMNYIDLPNGTEERPDGTFFGYISEGETAMDVDLIDDGIVSFSENLDGSYTVEGMLIGKDCVKRYFTWTGIIEVSSNVEPQNSNSTLTSDIDLSHLTIGQIEDKGDSFYLQDESYRCFLIYLAEEGIDFSSGRPAGSGDLLRLEILVPWESDINDGIPSGSYPMVSRNENSSVDRDMIVPFRSIPGLPDEFNYPYWAGTWYVSFIDGLWGNDYARIDRGLVDIEHIPGEGYMIELDFEDCALPANSINASIVLAEDDLKILTYF